MFKNWVRVLQCCEVKSVIFLLLLLCTKNGILPCSEKAQKCPLVFTRSTDKEISLKINSLSDYSDTDLMLIDLSVRIYWRLLDWTAVVGTLTWQFATLLD